MTEGNVYIEDGVITEIGNISRRDDLVVDAGGGIVMPGLINTHTHVAMTEFRGIVDDMNLEGFIDRTFKLDRNRQNESIQLSTELSLAEMILSGTTSFFDLYYSEDVIASVCEKMRVRSFLSWVTLDSDKTTQKGEPLSNAENFIKRYRGKPLIVPSVGLQGVYVCSRETCEGAAEIASKYSCTLHMHLSETRTEVYNHERDHGMRPVEWLSSFPFFRENRVVAAHGAWLTKNEMNILKRFSVSVAHCARSNMKLGSGIAPVLELMEGGVNVGIGTDSATTSNNLDMFEEMRASSYLQKVAKWDSAVLDASTVLDMATINGARALGAGDIIGSIEQGKRADIIVLDRKSVRILPLTSSNAITNAAYSAQGGDVACTIVDGRPLLLNRQFTKELRDVKVIRDLQDI